ncbi:MAG: hypothetical protein EHM21_16750, partial [Chloroflexi bacterium]
MNNPCPSGPVNNRGSKVSLLGALPHTAVQFTARFWKQHQEVNARVSLRHGYHILRQNGAFESFRRCAGLPVLEEPNPEVHEGRDTDVYKWLEAVAWQTAHIEDPELRGYINEVVPLIEAAQAEDGYLVTPILLFHPEKR